MGSQKRKARSDDFFFYTIEDNDEVAGAATAKGLSKEEQPKSSKKAKKEAAPASPSAPASQALEDEESGDSDGGDDFDPSFEFFDGGLEGGALFGDDEQDGGDEEEDGRATSRLGLKGADIIVDLNELIERRREKKERELEEKKEKSKKKKQKGSEEEDEEDEDENENEDEDDVDLDDADDEVLAADGFGMGAGSEDEEDAEDDEDGEGAKARKSAKTNNSDSEESEEEDDAASDNDSDATPVEDNMDSEDDSSSVSSSSSDDEDDEERARQDAFFAAGEQTKSQSKKDKNGKANGAASSAAATSFEAMRLFSRPILRGISAAGFETPTAIQAKTIPFAIGGHDVVGQAVTGSGKTAAFLLPILERLLHRPTNVPKTRVVVLTPTRELAVQCHKVAAKLAGFTSITTALTVGGTSFKSSEAGLRGRPDIVIGTPGRFIDHLRNSPSFAVDGVEILVLDEADRMLQDGFADELNEIVKTLPRGRQTLLFSATMGASVDQLIRVGLNKPVRIRAEDDTGSAGARTAGTLTQTFVRLRPGREDKRLGYLVALCSTLYRDHTIIFFREKRNIHEARIVFGLLGLSCEELHGNIKQAERLASLESFRRGAVRFLLASDLASRGLDIKGVETVINYEAPKNLEDYIHRIGRTARAGRRGVSVTIVAEKDRKFVKEVVKAMRGDAKAAKEAKGKKGKAEAAPQARIRSQQVDPAAADAWQAKIDAMEEDVAAVVAEEREARALARLEMEATRGENLLKHREEILSRPKRTWFESAREKESKRQQLRQAERQSEESKAAAVERLRESFKQKHGGSWLSGKDRKKLDDKQSRLEGLGGQKLKQEKKVMGARGNTKAQGKVIKGGKKPSAGRGPKVKGKAAKAGRPTKGRR